MQTMGNYIPYKGDRKQYKRKNAYVFWVYVLQLQKGRYYVGISRNVDKRIQQHKDGVGSKWTQLYHPVKLEKKIKTVHTAYLYASEIENSTTIEYMKRYGKENVRGGIYCAVEQNIVDAQLGFKLCKEIDKAYLIYQNKLNKSIKNRNQREVHLLSVSNDGVDGNKSLSQKKIIKKNDNQANDKSIYVVIHSKTENNKNKQNGYVKEKKTEKINQETSSFSNDMKRKVIASGVNRKASPQKKLKGGKCAREECGATVIKMSYGAICSECGQRYIMKRKK